jgi:hypothetical protein
VGEPLLLHRDTAEAKGRNNLALVIAPQITTGGMHDSTGARLKDNLSCLGIASDALPAIVNVGSNIRVRSIAATSKNCSSQNTSKDSHSVLDLDRLTLYHRVTPNVSNIHIRILLVGSSHLGKNIVHIALVGHSLVGGFNLNAKNNLKSLGSHILPIALRNQILTHESHEPHTSNKAHHHGGKVGILLVEPRGQDKLSGKNNEVNH